jgi:ribonuclease E
VRSVASVTLQLLRSIEEMLLKGATHNIVVRTRAEVALYVLNHKRAHLHDFETRFRISVTINADPTVSGQQPFVIERGEQVHSLEAAKAIAVQPVSVVPEAEEEPEEAAPEEEPAEATAEIEAGERRRRRRRRGRRGEEREPAEFTHETAAEHRVAHIQDDELAEPQEDEAAGVEAEPREREGEISDSERRRRRRGRRGGRRNRRDRDSIAAVDEDGPLEPEIATAVADFDHPPPSDESRQEAPAGFEPVAATPAAESPPAPPEAAVAGEPQPAPSADQPAAAPQPLPPSEPPAPELPRRRSTVREPAAFRIGSGEAPVALPPAAAPAAAPEVEIVTPAPEAAGQPRRTGWWARRLLGGDKH